MLLCRLGAIGQIRIEVVSPKLLLPDSPIYLAADFNNWQPGDIAYMLKKQPNGIFYIELPDTLTYFEYKFTQGSWVVVEGKANRSSRFNRVYNRATEPNPKLIKATIEGWEGKPTYRFVINQIPDNTPKDASLYISGNFNNWKAGDEHYKLQKQGNGTNRVAVVSESDHLEFKFTRGDWVSVEGQINGKARPNRTIFRSSIRDTENLSCEITSWEDLSGTFNFFSILDLLLLFSAFQSILLIIAIRSLQDYNRQANRWLVISLAFMAIMILIRVVMAYRDVAQIYTKLLFLPDFVWFLYAPLFYFYIQKLLFKSSKLSTRWWVHFVPALLQLMIYLPYFFVESKILQYKFVNQDVDLQLIYKVLGLLAWVFNLYYWIICRRLISSYRKLYANQASSEQNIQYLSAVLFIQAVCLALWLFTIVMYVVGYFFQINIAEIIPQSTDTIWLIFSTIPYFLGYFAIQQPEIFKLHETILPTEPQNITSVHESIAETKETEPDESLHVYKEQIDSFMEKQRPYANAGLTINELANGLKMQPHLLSKVINEVYGKNFFDFINEHRIEEFKKKFEDPRNKQYTLLTIAFEVGFNSKTAFNRAFKKMTQQTPREYFYESRAGE